MTAGSDIVRRADLCETPLARELRHQATQRAIADGDAPEPDILIADGGQQQWDPEPAQLRDGETRDDTSHAARNAAQLSMIDDELDSDDSTDPELPPLHVGDHATDRDEDDSATLVVVGTPPETAAERQAGAKTVAAWNPDYPAEDDVIEVVYADRTDVDIGPLKRYSFPRSRLALEEPVHDRDDEDGDSARHGSDCDCAGCVMTDEEYNRTQEHRNAYLEGGDGA